MHYAFFSSDLLKLYHVGREVGEQPFLGFSRDVRLGLSLGSVWVPGH